MNNRKLPQRDPIGAYQRQATAERRMAGKQCACGEARPEALIKGSDPTICAECQRKMKGQIIMDDHHSAGEANNSATTLVPVNDHRAVLNVAQYRWPTETRENPDRSPVLAAAGCVRGFVDTVVYLIEKLLLWIPEMLEKLDAFLVKAFGQKYWVNTELAQFAPKG